MLGVRRRPAAASANPSRCGEAVFQAIAAGVFQLPCDRSRAYVVGPSLAGIGTRAGRAASTSPDYKGRREDAEDYIRESIVNPNAYMVPGPTFSAGGQSVMPATSAAILKPEEVDELVAYLATLK